MERYQVGVQSDLAPRSLLAAVGFAFLAIAKNDLKSV